MTRICLTVVFCLTAAAARGGMIVQTWGPGKHVSHPATLTVADSGRGAVIEVDLSALPAGTKVFAARLFMERVHVVVPPRRRGQPPKPVSDDAMVACAVHPRRQLDGKPLAIVGPWFNCLDATGAVRRSAGRTCRLYVKPLPDWRKDRTRLEVAYQGQPRAAGPQVSGLRVFHRAGQTFITFKQVEDLAAGAGKPEVDWVPQDAFTWAQHRKISAEADAKQRIRYSVYRHGEPITRDNLHQAERIAVVGPLSEWNVNGANSERPIDLALANKYAHMHGHWNPFSDARVAGGWGRHCPLDRFVIEDGKPPLPSGTGLYVHTAAEKAGACYAVVVSVDGTENTAALSQENSLRRPVAESPAEPQPVLQRELPKLPFWNYPERRLHYVHWLAPPYTNLPSSYENFAVCVPAKLGASVPLELSLHRDDRSYWRTGLRVEPDSVVLRPYDWPRHSWWYGHHEALDTLKSFRQGVIHPYTERRVLWLMRWAAGKWPVDRSRILVTGVCRRSGGAGATSGNTISPTNGAARLALRYPAVFNLAMPGYGLVPDWRADAPGNLVRIWGDPKWRIRTAPVALAAGDPARSVWEELDLLRIVRALPADAAVPLVTLSTKVRGAAAPDLVRMTNLMLEKRFPIMFRFNYWPGPALLPVSARGTWPAPMVRVDVRRDHPLPAFRAVALRTHKQMLSAIPPADAKGTDGDVNTYFHWENVVDRTDRFEMRLRTTGRWDRGVTSDVTLRRRQGFRPAAGTQVKWSFKAPAGRHYLSKPTEQSGEATVGEDGRLTIPALRITGGRGTLVVTLK
jgi:hypothetical protein